MACTRHSIGIVLQTPVRPRFLVARKARLTSFLVFGCGGAEWHEIGIASPYRVPKSPTVQVSSPLDLRGPAQTLASVLADELNSRRVAAIVWRAASGERRAASGAGVAVPAVTWLARAEPKLSGRRRASAGSKRGARCDVAISPAVCSKCGKWCRP